MLIVPPAFITNYKLVGNSCLQFTVAVMKTLVLFLPGSLCLLFFLSVIIKFINKVWLTPIHIQSVMKSQGIKGPSYKLIHGNTKEIDSMIKTAATSPMELSHEIVHRVQPHFYAWMKLYGSVQSYMFQHNVNSFNALTFLSL